MMRDSSTSRQERLEALLDGRLGPADAAQAQGECAADLKLQESIDAALRGRFTPPPPDRVLAHLQAAGKAPTPLKARSVDWRRPLLVAACILALVGSGWWLAYNRLIPGFGDGSRMVENPRRNPPFAGPTVVEVHEALLAAGYKPTLPTADPRAIAASVWRRTGQGLQPANLPSGARVLGVSEKPCLSERSLVLLMEVAGKPLSLIVDKLENDRLYCVTAPMEITPFRREVGDLVIYEVTPHGKPLVYDSFVDPRQTKEWYEDGGGF